MRNKIENLVETPYCPNLQTRFLNHNQLKVIYNGFFQFMRGLKVLNLSYNSDIEELPEAISKLVSLEYLDLSWTKIRQLPIELKALEKLKCLNLECFPHNIRIPRQLISVFIKMQVLTMVGCYYSLEGVGCDNGEWLVEELECLMHLNVLTVTITSASGLDRFLSSERLCSSTVHIDLQLFKESKRLDVLFLANMRCLNSLHLRDCGILEELKIMESAQSPIASQQYCFESLRHVVINDCSKLMDITWVILAPNLRYLNVSFCCNMEEIINERKLNQVGDQLVVETLCICAKLESLFLDCLPELESIYWDTLPLSCLKDIKVVECPKLKRLPLNSSSAKECKIRIKGREEWWKELRWEDEYTRNRFLPCFMPGL